MIIAHLFIASLAFAALVFSGASVLLFANKYFPYKEAVVKSCTLRSIDNRNVKAVFFEIELDENQTNQKPVVFRFAGTDVEKIRNTKKFKIIESQFSPGSTIKIHYVPFFQWVGSFPETEFVRVEAVMSLIGAVISIGLTIFAVSEVAPAI